MQVIKMKSVFTYCVGLAVFVAVIAVSQLSLKHVRLDLTEQNIYSLSAGTKEIVQNIEQEIKLTLYFSDKASKDLTAFRSYAKRVQELLAEYALLSDGKLNIEVIDPKPFSEAEDQAAEFSLQAVPIGNGDEIYFGISAKNSAGDDGIISFLSPDKEAFLEYEISELIYRLGQKVSPVIGLMSSLPMGGGFDMHSGGTKAPWTVYEQLDQLYDLRWVDEKLQDIDKDIQLLILVQPQNLNEDSLYELDQYVLSGGKLLVFMDPKADSQQVTASQEVEAFERDISLNTLLTKWGVEYHPDIIIDSQYGLTVSRGQNQPPMRHLGLLGIQEDGLNANEITTADLEIINFGSSGFLTGIENSLVQFDSLVWSSLQAQVMDAEQYESMQDPVELLKNFSASDESYILAARLSGPVNSAFQHKPLNSVYEGDHIPSHENINVIIVADTDVLTDRLWVQVQNFFGQRAVQPWADNGAFVGNLVQQYLGSASLINIRSRGRFNRTFEVVQDLKLKAQDDYLSHERALEEQLQETEQQLAMFEQLREKGSLTLSADQESTLANFQHEKLRIRKALRDVRHELDKDIESLATQLKLLNIIVFPLLLTALLLLLARFWLRGKK